MPSKSEVIDAMRQADRRSQQERDGRKAIANLGCFRDLLVKRLACLNPNNDLDISTLEADILSLAHCETAVRVIEKHYIPFEIPPPGPDR